MEGEKYTLKDIAKMAKVSRGTVDRVIHGRGKVSEETRKKIQLILDKLNYKPNLVAQTLRKGAVCRLAVLLPDYKNDIFWKRPTDGVERAAKDYSSIGVRVDKFLFNSLKSTTFRNRARSILEAGYDGILVAPLFYKESMDFFHQCDELGLPYITFNTYIEDSNALCHIGQDLIQSGQTAASLINMLLENGDEILIVHIEEELENSMHMQEKETGFRQFFADRKTSPGFIHILKVNSLKRIDKLLMQSLDKNPGIKAIYVSTSKVNSIVGILRKYGLSMSIIGYDLLEENIRYLESGEIDFLIYQNPGLQANLGISTLVDHLVFKTEAPHKKLLPIEIVIRENIENYLQ